MNRTPTLPLLLLIAFAACGGPETKREPVARSEPEKPLPLGVYITKLDGLLRQWNEAKNRPETTQNLALRRSLEGEIQRRVEQRFDELRNELETGVAVRNRVVLAAALGFAKKPEALNPLIDAVHDPAPEVREQALLGLAQLCDPNTPADQVAELMSIDSTEVEQGHASLCLYRLAQSGVSIARALPTIRAGAKGRNPVVKVHCIAALGEAHDTESLDLLLSMLRSERGLAGAATANAIGKLGDTAAVSGLIEALSAPDYAVRVEARGALRRLNGGEDLGSEPGPWLQWSERIGLQSRPAVPASAPAPAKPQ